MWNDNTPSTQPVRSSPGERLTALELAAWRGLLRVQAQTLRALEARMTATHALTNAEYEVLLRLSEQPRGRMRMAALADAIIRPRSTLTRVVSGLGARGLVDREEDAQDGRGASAVLSADGRRLFRAAQRTHLAQLRRAFLDPLASEQLAHLADAWHSVDPSVLLPAPDEPVGSDWTTPALVVVEMTAHARCIDRLSDEVDSIVERIRLEAACRRIEAWRSTPPGRLLLVEQWDSLDALRSFQRDSSELHDYLDRTAPYLRRPRQVTVARVVADGDE